MNQEIYAKITDALVDDGYVVMPNALSSALSKNLLEFAKKSKGFKRAGISARKKLNSSKRRDKILWLNDDKGVQSEFLDFAEGLKEYLNRELFTCITYFESHFALYEDGDFYAMHYDAFKNSVNRIVTVVYYLNEEWSPKAGGELIMCDDDGNFVKKVLPEANTLVVFLSEKFPHEVLPTKRKRYSVAGWFRIDKR